MKHQQLASGRWHTFSIAFQLGNIGSEVERALGWRHKGVSAYEQSARERMLELLDLTLADPRWQAPRLKELARLREVLCDFFYGDNIYHSNAEALKKYFLPFALLARRNG